MSHAQPQGEPQLGNPQAATLSTGSCSGFRFKLAQTAPAQNFLNLTQTLKCTVGHRWSKAAGYTQHLHKKKHGRGSCNVWLQKVVSYLDPNNQKPTALKKFPLRALFLLVTVVVRKSGWNMEPYDHQKMLWSLSIQIDSMSRRTNPALYAAWQRNSSMASSEGTAGILNKMYSLYDGLITQ